MPLSWVLLCSYVSFIQNVIYEEWHIMLNVVMQNVVMLSVVVPFYGFKNFAKILSPKELILYQIQQGEFWISHLLKVSYID